jgi:hypothetical protein
LLASEENAGGFAEVDVGSIAFDALDHTTENHVFFVFIFGENNLALGFS